MGSRANLYGQADFKTGDLYVSFRGSDEGYSCTVLLTLGPIQVVPLVLNLSFYTFLEYFFLVIN
jgi:hypothetical protein